VRAVERLSIEADLRRAIDHNEFVLHYQPKVDLCTGKVTGSEALIRWVHPTKGMIWPESFIEIAEDCGLIIPIGRTVLRQACTQMKEWINQGIAPMIVSVNVSALEFRHHHFLKSVREILKETEMDPRFLQLELTESVLMGNLDSNMNVLKSLKDLGVQLAVDDFGTGYSSLSYLHQFPIDVLKIDQSFVRGISGNVGNGIIVNAVISMGTSLNQSVVAEGIETQEQWAFLNAHKCNEGQGHLFGRPMPPEDFARIVQSKEAS
jgi:EAL domain-containing protein (putative c-di-GMP-specific phosphodiesterase class I)